jgi:hypothetical protein
MSQPRDEQKQIAEIIEKNLGFRMALAIAHPDGFKENVKILAADLAKEIVNRPRG